MHFREIRASFFVFELKNILSARNKKQKENFRSHLDLPRVTFKFLKLKFPKLVYVFDFLFYYLQVKDADEKFH